MIGLENLSRTRAVVADNALLLSCLILLSLAFWLLWALYKRHMFFSKLPGPPHSFFLGHAKALHECMQHLPPDGHPQLLMSEICRRYDLYEFFYLNLFPIQWEPMLVIGDPEVAAQVTQLPGGGPLKHPNLEKIIKPFTGKYGIITQEGNEHKALRALFNPGFSARNLMELVPAMVDEGEVFVECLANAAASGKPVPIDHLAVKVTFDVIGRVALGEKFNAQRGKSAIVDAFADLFREQGTFPQSPVDPRLLFTWKQRIMVWYHGRRIDRLVREAVIRRLEAKREEEREAGGPGRPGGGAKLIVDLALKEYLATDDFKGNSSGGTRNRTKAGHVDETFLDMAVDNIKTFLFAGHDTTSSTITFSLYLLSEHPEILQQVREEHDRILGTDLDSAADRIRSDPAIVNQLVLTQAVIKETLRIYPPASSARLGSRDLVIRSASTGELYPTENHLLWVVNHLASRNPHYYPSPSFFIPARFLPTPPPPLPAIPPNAFRPFEKGARNCIGQELAMLESRTILALAVRRFDFEAAFGRGKGSWKEEVTEPDGLIRYPEGAYQVLIMTAKPKDGLLMKVTDKKQELDGNI